jgi:hypothetical protein
MTTPKTKPKYDIDFHNQVTLPIRDMGRSGKIKFLVTVYGWHAGDVCIVPGGSAPFMKAVKRLGLDSMRYQAVMWEAPV